jgi:protoporphyrinogen IX oxidase
VQRKFNRLPEEKRLIMDGFLLSGYLWIKAAHIFSVIAWMAGLFYLPRLFVYHTKVDIGSDQDTLFQTMEEKLLRIIMNPAMIATWGFGILLFLTPGVADFGFWWVKLKLAMIILLSVFHMRLAGHRRAFAEGRNQKPEKYFRKINEVPTILALAIVIMVVVKPF